MNLQPVPIDEIPLGEPLPWRLYDRNGYIVFARGEMVASREQLVILLTEGLLRDVDAPPQTHETEDWIELKEAAPVGTFPPAGVKPQIGERVQLRSLNSNLQSYYSARLIGYIKNLSILVTRPMADEIPFIPVEGEPVEVRMLTGNNIYAFQSSIQRLCISPTNYLHLDYPTKVQVQKLRKSPWASVNLGVTVTDAQGVHEAAQLVNLSADGAQLHASITLGKEGDALQLSFHATIDERNIMLNLDATILHVRTPQIGETDSQEYNIAFHDVSTENALWLKGLVYRYIAEGNLA